MRVHKTANQAFGTAVDVFLPLSVPEHRFPDVSRAIRNILGDTVQVNCQHKDEDEDGAGHATGIVSECPSMNVACELAARAVHDLCGGIGVTFTNPAATVRHELRAA